MSTEAAATAAQAAEAAEAAARRSYGKLVAFLAARTRDVAAAEDALAEAFATALVDWPRNGIPRTPEAIGDSLHGSHEVAKWLAVLHIGDPALKERAPLYVRERVG